MTKSYEKALTKNDTGETGGHQAGIVVPKRSQELIDFFPQLDIREFNPDVWLTCIDPDGEKWEMRYIYYNGRIFTPAKSTRNEYRLTHMTKFFSKWRAKAGDSVVFTSTKHENTFLIRVILGEEESQREQNRSEPKTVILKGWRPVF
ncbi:EcoRII N-terminal effector-binding domain-containing protein [Idiomarina abyssalis]|uniref:EcoRII N-terminal effector-binding domain-containing protein n=1 Tax=Idiomarina abyssalis TaxID=86102 RepID=UPI0006C83516|nr:EcoRII N-terminal effector-binding domain-containing protein [Idiomarina abyssalis]KPD21006.1 hypothetical protein ADS78_09615 [Idiomarina abyssalis]SFT84117.1 Restriction endonuclease EcoRII, N-terminal [Idiomarina abyssalis]